MAKECSFDVVSTVDMQEVDNAYQQAARELTQRYDLKGTGASLELSKKDGSFKLEAPSEFVAGQVRDVLGGKIIQGIDQDTAKKISKDIRDLKLKCKPTVEGDKLRVSSASRDVLQEVIAFLKQQDYGQPLQFNNYR